MKAEGIIRDTFDPKRLGCVPIKNEKGEMVGRILSIDEVTGRFIADIYDCETIDRIKGNECSMEVIWRENDL